MTYPNGWDGPKVYASQLGEPVPTDFSAGTPVTGIVPLRPLTLGDILGAAFRAVRFAPSVMFGLTLLVVVAAQLLGTLTGYVLQQQFGSGIMPFDGAGLDDLALLSWTSVTGAVSGQLVSIVLGMGLIHTVSAAVTARRVTPVEALRHVGRRLGPAIGLSALGAVAVLGYLGVVVGLGAVAVAAGSSDSGAVVVVLAVVLEGVLLVWIGTRVLFAPCAIAMEGLGPLRAVGRSWRLTTGLFWRTLGIYLLASVLISLAAGTVTQVFSFAALLFSLQDLSTAGEMANDDLTVVRASLARA